MNITVSKENYLKTIAEAESEGESVIAATLARWLGISPPAVTAGLNRLGRDGLVQVAKNGRIALTEPGREIARRLLNRHHLVERMLTEIFGMEWYKVHDEAERLEHAVSDEFEARLQAMLGSDKACPHGNLVSADTPEERRARGQRPLDEIERPARLVVVSVFERDRKLLEFLEGLNLRPGTTIEWLARNYDETVTLRVDDEAVQLGGPAARRIWVKSAVEEPHRAS